MSRILSSINALMPVMFLVVTGIAIFEFLSQHERAGSVAHFVATHAYFWSAFAGMAAALWLLLLACIIYAHAGDVSARRTWLHNILNRLINRKAYAERAAYEEVAPVFIDANTLSHKLKTKVIGQDAVCDDVAAQIRRRLALRIRGKPIGIFLLAGPPGTGKTYLAKCLAQAMKRPLIHLDMTQFARGGAAATQLFGSSKGYVGSDTYGKLTLDLSRSPDAIVLLDEFEKAHPEVHKNFLTAWNDGFVTEASDGAHVSTTQAIFFLTTNAAVKALTELSLRTFADPDKLRIASIQALMDWGFAPEVLNRIDRIFVFRPLHGADIAKVGALEIEAMIRNYGLAIDAGGISPTLLSNLARHHEVSGSVLSSRDLVRSIEERIADSLIEAKRRGETRIALIERQGAIVAVPASPSPPVARDYFDTSGEYK